MAIRSGLKAQVHAVLAEAGVLIAATDLFGVDGRQRLEKTALAGPYAGRVASLLRIVDDTHRAELLTRIGLPHDHRPLPMQIDTDELSSVITHT